MHRRRHFNIRCQYGGGVCYRDGRGADPPLYIFQPFPHPSFISVPYHHPTHSLFHTHPLPSQQSTSHTSILPTPPNHPSFISLTPCLKPSSLSSLPSLRSSHLHASHSSIPIPPILYPHLPAPSHLACSSPNSIRLLLDYQPSRTPSAQGRILSGGKTMAESWDSGLDESRYWSGSLGKEEEKEEGEGKRKGDEEEEKEEGEGEKWGI
ncbi:hypothetical protein Pmani_029441 [Petrolisthes manimaculis]|uniref:Uncharacterized protein n=1 Tax=Petrolisthes manimaculis TaxID=1843537 RepID=A0AAE1NXJ6_9EUCA|nr:hypothetical protein Pmani_029441 [Petrolisthes manimaculis]